MTHTPEELAMARRIAADFYAASDNPDFQRFAVQVRLGKDDDDEAVQCALLAIQATTEAAAHMADCISISLPGVGVGLADGASIARNQIVARLRDRAHLKGNHHDSI